MTNDAVVRPEALILRVLLDLPEQDRLDTLARACDAAIRMDVFSDEGVAAFRKRVGCRRA